MRTFLGGQRSPLRQRGFCYFYRAPRFGLSHSGDRGNDLPTRWIGDVKMISFISRHPIAAYEGLAFEKTGVAQIEGHVYCPLQLPSRSAASMASHPSAALCLASAARAKSSKAP